MLQANQLTKPNIALNAHSRCCLILLAAVVCVCFATADAFAMKADDMSEGLSTLESFLRGNVLRMIIIGGCIYGGYQAYAAGKPTLLGGAIATGLGINFVLSWIDKAWTMVL